MHNIPGHQIYVWQLDSRIGYFKLGLAILVHKRVALFIHKIFHLIEASRKHPQPTLNAAHNYWEKGNKPTMREQNCRIRHVGNNYFMRECWHHTLLQPYNQKSHQQSSVRNRDPGLMMKTLKNYISFESILI